MTLGRMERTATLYHLRDALLNLAAHDGDRMTTSEDQRYQQLCAWGAPMARALGDAELERLLSIAACTCHSCLKETPP